MSIEEKFKANNLVMQIKVKQEIEKVINGTSSKNLSQLNTILEELIIMLNEKQLPVKFSRFIVDSWDYQDKLGLELLDLVELYKRCK